MQKKSSTKQIIIFVVLIVIAVFAYFYFSGTPNDDSTSGLKSSQDPDATAESTDAQVAGSRILSLLTQIQSIKIDTKLFKSAIYKSLVDYSVEVPSQPVGRQNPFAPVR